MLKDEHKFVLNLLRENDIDRNVEYEYNKIIEILRKHKIFLHFFDKLNWITNDDFKNKINNLYNIYMIRNSIYKKFLKAMVSVLNQNNVNYIIYKGLVLNNIIYGEKNLRTYTDIDLIIDDTDILIVLNMLIKNFECTNSHIIENFSLSKEELELNFIYYTFNICVEIKTSNKFYLKKDLNDKVICYIDDVPCYTFNNEYTLINLISHHYFMTENINPIKYSNRFILQYLLDIKKFIDTKKINISNFQMLLEKYEMKMQMFHILMRIREIFNDYTFGNDYIDNKILASHIDDNRFISFIDQYFNKDEIVSFIKKYCLAYLTFDQKYLQIRNDIMFYPYVGLKQYINIKVEKDNFVIIFNSMDLDNNHVLYVCIYCYDIYGEYCTPYIPIAIKLIEGAYKYYIGWSIDINSCLYDVYDGLYKDVDQYIRFANNVESIKISLSSIKFANVRGRINLNKTISVNVHLLEIRYKTIIRINSLVNKFDFPIKIKCI